MKLEVLKMSDYNNKKSRYWAFILYPDSASCDWANVIADIHLPILVSPLHEPDEEDKKRHYHILLLYDGPTTYKVAQQDIITIGGKGVTVPQLVRSKVGYARYLCHLDEKDKPHYEPSKVTEFGGAKYLKIINEVEDRASVVMDIIDYIDEKHCYSFSSLVYYCKLNKRDWLRVLVSNSSTISFINSYIRSVKEDSGIL